jgi:hypothetical protein
MAKPTDAGVRPIGGVGGGVYRQLHGNTGGAVSVPGTGKMEHRQVVLGLLLPTDQEPAKAVHPGVRALDDPAAGTIPRDLAFGLLLLATGTDVGAPAEGLHQLTHLGVVVALVQAEVGTLVIVVRLGRGWCDGHAVEGLLQHLEVVAIGASNREAYGDSPGVGDDAAFGPGLAPVRRIGPRGAPPKGALVMAPSIASQLQSIPSASS